jgi:hypothetical protein
VGKSIQTAGYNGAHTVNVFSTGAMGALAPAILGHFITVSQGQHPQWKNSINILAPAILKS